MTGPATDLAPLIAAGTAWLARAYPATGPAGSAQALVELQARQAVTVAAWLRWPTPLDAALVALSGTGGCAVLDWRVGADPGDGPDSGWRSWVDEVVVSWAACLLADPELARRAVAAVAAAVPGPPGPDADAAVAPFRRLTDPDPEEGAAAVLLRHPDLTEPVAALHRADLGYLLGVAAAA